MNKAITDGLVLMPPPFSAGLNLWSREDGVPGSGSYQGQPNAALVTNDQDFAGCLELQKTEATQKLRSFAQTPIQPGLRRQVVHNDFNHANVLVDPDDHDRIAGVIDFGDMAETAVVFDAAIAAHSQNSDDLPIVEAAGHMLRRYHAISPLLPEEAAILPLLMATRAIMGVTLACYHHHAQPDNDHSRLVR